MPPQAPWSPTAHAFAHHQFSHVANFWKQGRQASFRLEALHSGQAELNLTFQLPPASEVIEFGKLIDDNDYNIHIILIFHKQNPFSSDNVQADAIPANGEGEADIIRQHI